VYGIVTTPHLSQRGWWVGEVHDRIAGDVFAVWFLPGERRMALSRRDPEPA
jgi:hypothetical protein